MSRSEYVMRLALVRHGQTEWNVEGRCQGWEDVPLNDVGILQGKKVAERLSQWRIDEILTSDLSRAHDTAISIAEKVGLEPLKRSGLRELRFGQCQGQRYADLQGTPLGRAWEAFRRGDHFGALPDGEHPDEVVQRFHEVFQEAWDRAVAGSGKKNVVMVGHGGLFRLAICKMLEIPLRHWRQFGQGNAAISVMEFRNSGMAQLALLNDTSHLQSVPPEADDADTVDTAG